MVGLAVSACALSVVYTLVLECVGDGVSLCSSVVCVLFVELLGWQCQFVPFWDLYSVRKVVGLAVYPFCCLYSGLGVYGWQCQPVPFWDLCSVVKLE